MSEPEGNGKTWSRWWLWALIGLPLLAILLLVGLEIALHQEGVQRAIRDELAMLIAERTGLTVEVETLRPSLFASRVDLEGVAVRVADEKPILTAGSISVGWRLSSLWQRPFTLETLLVSTPSPSPSPRSTCSICS